MLKKKKRNTSKLKKKKENKSGLLGEGWREAQNSVKSPEEGLAGGGAWPNMYQLLQEPKRFHSRGEVFLFSILE